MSIFEVFKRRPSPGGRAKPGVYSVGRASRLSGVSEEDNMDMEHAHHSQMEVAGMDMPTTHHQVDVDGIRVFYREAGDPMSPKLVLMGGFPASSHQFRNLIPALASRFHVISPDYPGFGNTDMPDPEQFPYTFDKLSEVVEGLLRKIGFTRFGLYVQDYGGPVGFRIVSRHPEWLEWLIIQNSNTYEEGFTSAWDSLRNALWKERTPETEAPLAGFLELDGIRQVYLHGHKAPELISPDNWNMDYRFMERPNARRVQLDLFYDYRTNVALYPAWQTFLRERQPHTLILWGQNDIFFSPQGGEAYLRDLPNAELHRLDSGHFAVEDCLEIIATNIRRFYDDVLVPAMPMETGASIMQDRSTAEGMSMMGSQTGDMAMAPRIGRGESTGIRQIQRGEIGEGSYACPACGTSFPSPAARDEHGRMAH